MQLEAIKAERGDTKEQELPDKPLAQVLADAKQAKEDAFQAQWKQMKTGAGTMKPLQQVETDAHSLRLSAIATACVCCKPACATRWCDSQQAQQGRTRESATGLGPLCLRLWVPWQHSARHLVAASGRHCSTSKERLI